MHRGTVPCKNKAHVELPGIDSHYFNPPQGPARPGVTRRDVPSGLRYPGPGTGTGPRREGLM